MSHPEGELAQRKKALLEAEIRLHTQQLRDRILEKQDVQALHALCERENFQAHFQNREIMPRRDTEHGMNHGYVYATEQSALVVLGGMEFRSSHIRTSVSKREQAFYCIVEHRPVGGSWSMLFEDGSSCGELVGFLWDEEKGWALERCKKEWESDLDLYTLADFIKNTLLHIEIGDDYLEELLEE